MMTATVHFTSRSRRVMDAHSHRVAVVRELPRPVVALGASAW